MTFNFGDWLLEREYAGITPFGWLVLLLIVAAVGACIKVILT